ncbi:hypothetical protein DI487_09875 [Flavobacterium sediminis]|uniref:Uncharacterized protein n=1 Tax=Flavobacterium sediminis TaxID=2201181 RepID=A0A2U8QW55_9FLAO|nr:metallophosphoesterase [Flavobacterium sediminis]AWM14126.1 hypothetical protein DI487_09875 [Flavobacterium sediminis]
MIERKLRVAVVSDLHCHPKEFKLDNNLIMDDTYLYTDSLRENDHPIESLASVLKDEKVDLIICPGDFTNKSNLQGFISGWNYVLEIQSIFNSEEVIATLGNHDIDSYNNYSSYSLKNARGIKKNFPLRDENSRRDFWANGCAFVERENFRVLVINSCHFHYNKVSAKSGEIDENMINFIDEHMAKISDNKIQIVLTHHHPIDHSVLDLGEEDKIINSEKLLEVLGKFKFDLIIHGHKHHPLLRYHPLSKIDYRIPIFASGSFSSVTNLKWTSSRNYFHIIEIEKKDEVKGEIFSWTYFSKQGWIQNFDQTGFAPHAGFGNKLTIDCLVKKIKILIGEKLYIKWEEIENSVPEIKYLIPNEIENLTSKLLDESLKPDSHISNFPKMLFKIQ